MLNQKNDFTKSKLQIKEILERLKDGKYDRLSEEDRDALIAWLTESSLKITIFRNDEIGNSINKSYPEKHIRPDISLKSTSDEAMLLSERK